MLNRVVREDLKEGTFEYRFKDGEGGSHGLSGETASPAEETASARSWGRTLPGMLENREAGAE